MNCASEDRDNTPLMDLMRYLSLERMLLSVCSDEVLRDAIHLSASLSPFSMPQAWLDRLLDLRQQHPGFPRVRWNDHPHLIREYWLLSRLNTDSVPFIKLDWDAGMPYWGAELSLAIPTDSPLLEIYVLSLVGVSTGYAKALIEPRYSESDQLVIYEQAVNFLRDIDPAIPVDMRVLDVGKFLKERGL